VNEHYRGILGDLEKILADFGHRPQVVHGLVVAAGHSLDASESERAYFLLSVLEKISFDLSWNETIHGEALAHLLKITEKVFDSLEVGDSSLYHEVESKDLLGRVTTFLAFHPPFQGLRGKIRSFLREVSPPDPRSRITGCFSLVRALVNYQMYDLLEVYLGWKATGGGRFFAAIPVLYDLAAEGLEGQVSREELFAMVESGVAMTLTLKRVRDFRVLGVLLALADDYVAQNGKEFPIRAEVERLADAHWYA